MSDPRRLRCRYAPCPNSPPFDCKMKTSDGLPLPDPLENCTLPLPRHRALHGNATTSYNCTLTRKGRREELRIVIDYSVGKGRGGCAPPAPGAVGLNLCPSCPGHIKDCRGTSGARLHGAPPLLWPAAALSLWAVLGAA